MSRSAHPRMRPRTRAVLGFAAVACMFLAGCFRHNAAPEEPAAALTEATATSNTSFLLRFSSPLGEGADVPSNYLIRDPDGVMLPVVAAHPRDGGAAVALATEPQEDVAYTITVRNVALASGDASGLQLAAPGEVPGSATAAPYVADAVALSNTEVLVTFGMEGGALARMNDDALDLAMYRFRPALSVQEAAFADDGSDRGRVVLTTASMAGDTYTLRVGAVTSGRPEALLDPFRSERSFVGIAAIDEIAPTLSEAFASDGQTVVATFSEPVRDHAADPSRYTITDDSGAAVTISGATQDLFGTRVTLVTSALDPSATYTLAASDIADVAGNVIAADATATFAGVAGGSDGRAPRVVGATSTGPTRVLVAFSEPVQGGAENPDHYSIVGSATLEGSVAPQAVVDVTAAELAGDGRSVVLTTLAQSEIEYTLKVSNVVDLDGNAIAGPNRERPFAIEFFGSAESGSGTDGDGDGLSDAEEQRGWTVTIAHADGSVTSREVTSDPRAPDSDDDGIGDRAEKTYRIDPRDADSDDDELTDARELNEIYSEPAEADSDGDGLGDGLEVDFFTTSALYADTDGDQFDDGYEVTTDNRNPRVADLPVVEIEVGNVDLQLDVRFEEQNSQGTTTVDTKNVSTTLERSTSSRDERVESSTLEGFFEALASGCYGGGCPSGGETLGNWGASLTVGGGFSTSDTTTTTSESARSTQDAYARSLTTEAEASAESTITRVVEGAAMAVAVSITNPGNVAYTVRDIEITALVQNGRDASSLVPVATLEASGAGDISVGPLNPTRGPFRFTAQEAFPSLVEQLMQNPRGIVFRVANYSLEDEFGRRFAFVQQDVNDRTAGFEVDYAGNLQREIYQVATNAGFTASGAPTGVAMSDVLEGVLGLTYVPEADDVDLDPTVREDAEIIDTSYSTRTVNGVEVLSRLRGVSSELTGEERTWWVITSEGLINPVGDNPGRDFRDVTVLAETDFVFKFVQDLDDDGIEKAVEATYGSVDSDIDTDADTDEPDSRDTDDDGIDDGVEPFGPYVGNGRDPWTIRFDDGRDAYQTSANPARADTDFDGLTDCQELLPTEEGTTGGEPLACSLIDVYLDGDGVATVEPTATFLVSLRLPDRTDPADIDTDDDGLTDLEELLGFRYPGLDGQTIELLPSVAGPATNPVSRDTDHDNLDDRREIRLGSDPTRGDEDSVIDEDGDGLVNLQETTGWEIVWIDGAGQHSAVDASAVDDPDTDDDGLTDWEEYHGCRDADGDLTCDTEERFGPTRPIFADSDADGLSDREEIDGADFAGDDGVRYTDPLRIDTDGDGRNDGDEVNAPWSVDVAGRGGFLVWSDPVRVDADGDGLNDAEEFSEETDPTSADSDGDGALDGLEVSRVVTDPLVPDHLVTVTYLGVQAGKGIGDADGDGDDGTNSGDFWFNLGARVPDSAGTLQSRSIVGSWNATQWDGSALPACASETESDCRGQIDGSAVIQLASPSTFHMNARTQFSLPFTSAFTLEGRVQELDPPSQAGFSAEYTFDYGGPGDGTATYSGSTLQKGTFVEAFSYSSSGHAIDVTVQVTVE